MPEPKDEQGYRVQSTVSAGLLSEFVEWDAKNWKFYIKLSLEIEPKLYPVTLTLDNGLITKNYILNVTVLELKAPYFIQEERFKFI